MNIRNLFQCFCFVGVLLGTSAQLSAQDIRWKPETLKKGDFVVIDQGAGKQVAHVFRGKKGRGYLLETYDTSRPKSEAPFRTVLDRNGNYLDWTRPDGYKLKFRPHDCTRTLGQCHYTQVFPDGRKEGRTRITKATNAGLEFKEYDAKGKFFLSGTFALDARGNAGTGWVKGLDRKVVHKLVRSVYQ